MSKQKAEAEAEKPAEPEVKENTLTREAEDALLQKYVGSTQFDNFTRERFLKRIRAMQEEDKPIVPMGRTPAMMPQFEAEQAAGRAAVRKAEGKPQLEQEQAAGRAALKKFEQR
jgi:hypothetical protein